MEHSEEEVEDMYEKIEQLLDDETKSKDYTVVSPNIVTIFQGEPPQQER